MFFLKEDKINPLEEVKIMFPKEKLVRLRSSGNSELFISDKKVIKYLTKDYFKPYLRNYNLLKRRTDIRLPELLGTRKSKILDYCMVIMRKDKGDLLEDVWEDFSIEKKELILKKMTLLLKKINSISLSPRNVSKSLVFFSKDLNWKEEVRGFCLSKLDEYKGKGFIKKSLYDFLFLVLNENIDYVQNNDYVLLHNDFHFRNLLIDKNFNLTLLFDFETFSVGDKYLDLVIAGSFLREKYQKMLFDFYGRSENFEEISKVYRLIMSINFFKKVNIKEGQEVIRFIEKGFPFFNFEPKKEL